MVGNRLGELPGVLLGLVVAAREGDGEVPPPGPGPTRCLGELRAGLLRGADHLTLLAVELVTLALELPQPFHVGGVFRRWAARGVGLHRPLRGGLLGVTGDGPAGGLDRRIAGCRQGGVGGVLRAAGRQHRFQDLPGLLVGPGRGPVLARGEPSVGRGSPATVWCVWFGLGAKAQVSI